MKTIFSVAILGILALTSCKKEYTCECSVTVKQPAFSFGGQVIQQASTNTTSGGSTTIKDKEAEAKRKCESGNGTTSVASPYAQAGAQPTTTTTTCSIK